jgi:uncharacterized repeat protein (TIGR03803 family)
MAGPGCADGGLSGFRRLPATLSRTNRFSEFQNGVHIEFTFAISLEVSCNGGQAGVLPGHEPWIHAHSFFGIDGGGDSNPAQASTESPPSITGSRWRQIKLHDFGGTGDGGGVNNNLVMRQGALYGTTSNGGAFKNGTVFQLKQASGVWNETILYSFAGAEGANPGDGLMLDAAGNLYGTTIAGGASTNCGNHSGCGVVFELSPPAVSGDPWTEEPSTASPPAMTERFPTLRW